MLEAAQAAQTFVHGKTREMLDSDLQLVFALVKAIEIIGEAVNRILKRDKNFEIANAQKIIGARNRIAHGYDKISDDLIWSIVINHLPKLKSEIQIMLEKL